MLVNGCWVAPYSVPDINKRLTSFVNVDAIPLGAIQRIEILKDGASAIYRSDAMAGVVSIILRTDYRRSEVEVNAQTNQHSHFGSRRAFKSQFSSMLNLCSYSDWDDATQYVTPMERQSLFSHGELVLGGGVSLFGELGLTHLTNKQRDWPVPFGSGLGATPNGRDGGVSFVPQYLPAGHPNNPFSNQPAGITYLFQDVGMQGIDVSNNSARLLVRARGMFRDMDWEVGLLHARDETRVSYLNRISLPALRDAVLNASPPWSSSSSTAAAPRCAAWTWTRAGACNRDGGGRST